MAVLLPLITFCELFVLIDYLAQKRNVACSKRYAFLTSSVVWAVLLIVFTEILSIQDSLNFVSLAGFWACFAILLFFLIFYLIHLGKIDIKTFRPFDFKFQERSLFDTLCICALLVIISAVALTAWVAPPQTWDVLTYHMSRIMHWMANQSLANYATADLRQLFMPPGAEMIMLHFHLLSHSDRFANLVQWFSMVGSLMAVSLIAFEFGANKKGQLLSALIAATIPMGIIQASSSKNQFVVTFWMISFVYFGIRYFKRKELTALILSGLSLSLAVLTKPSSFIFALPLVLFGIVALIQTYKFKALKWMGLFCLLVISLNVGYGARLYDLLGNPAEGAWEKQAPEMYVLKMDQKNMKTFASNALRNLLMHFGTPSEALNQYLEELTLKLHEWMGQPLLDKSTTYGAKEFEISFARKDVRAGCPLHIALSIIALLGVLFLKKFRVNKILTVYAGCIILAFAFFCFNVKWNPFHTRTHLTLLILSAPVIALWLQTVNSAIFKKAVILCLVLFSSVFVGWNHTRPLFGENSIFTLSREELYFAADTSFYEDFKRVEQVIETQEFKKVGLVLEADHWEYPLWMLLEADRTSGYELRHMNIDNLSEKYYVPNFDADLILYTRYDPQLAHIYSQKASKSILAGRFGLFIK